jgi:hypothetical protein
MTICPFTASGLCKLPIQIILILQLLHIGSRPGLLLILLRQRKQQTVAPLSYILTLPMLKRLLNRVNILSPRINILSPRINILSPRINILSPRINVMSPKRLQLGDILGLIRVVLVGCIKMMLIHFGKGLIH